MKRINLNYKNQLTNQSFLDSLHHSQEIEITLNLTKEDDIKLFANILGTLSNLKGLSLTLRSGHTQSSFYQIYKALENLINIVDFKLQIKQKAYIHAEQARQISKALKKMNQIQKLSLEICDLVDLDAIINLKKGIQTIKSLQYLDLNLRNGNVGNILSLFQQHHNLISLSLQLQQIGMNNNDFEGLVESISYQKNLQNLKLQFYNNELEEKIRYQQIGRCLQSLQELTHLNLEIFDDNLSQEDMISFKNGLQQISKLTLASFEFKGQIYQKFNPLLLFEGLKYHQDLETLKLKGMVNQNDNLDCFNGLSHVKNIELNLEVNELDVQSSNSLCQGMRQLKSVRNLIISFSFSSLKISIDICREFGKALKRMIELEELKILFLKNSNIEIGGAIKLGRGLSKLKNLRKLFLKLNNGNQIGEEGLKSIAKSFYELELLEDLTIHIGKNNQINSEGFKIFNEGISMLNSLTKLNLTVESIPVQAPRLDISYLGKGLINLFLLKELELNLNYQFIGQEQRQTQFIDSFKQLFSLQYLKLYFNSTTNYKFINQLLPSFQNLGLESLFIKIADIDQNYQYLHEIMDSISKIKPLKSLYFQALLFKARFNNPTLVKFLKQVQNLQKVSISIPQNNQNLIISFFKRYIKTLVIFKNLNYNEFNDGNFEDNEDEDYSHNEDEDNSHNEDDDYQFRHMLVHQFGMNYDILNGIY